MNQVEGFPLVLIMLKKIKSHLHALKYNVFLSCLLLMIKATIIFFKKYNKLDVENVTYKFTSCSEYFSIFR